MANNRMSSANWVYDDNGNTTQMPVVGGGAATLGYDIDNRVVSWYKAGVGTEYYEYLPDNKRVWKKTPAGAETVFFYGVGGQKLVTYTVQGSPFALVKVTENVYFGGKLIRGEGAAVVHDRLGSVVWREGVGGRDYFPYGDEMGTASAGNVGKFGTYLRDQTTGLDYADQRYFASLSGRFLSADPATPGDPGEPGSWNFYSYVSGDPVNYFDPDGLTKCGDLIDAETGFKVSTIMNGTSEMSVLAKLMWHEAGPPYSTDPNYLAAFDKEQLMIGTAMENRLDIAKQNIIIFDGEGNQVMNHGFVGKTLKDIIIAGATRYDSAGRIEHIFSPNGSFITSEQKILDQALGADIANGMQIPIPNAYVESNSSVNQVCYGVLRSITNARKVIGGVRENGPTPNTTITSWNKGSKGPGYESISVTLRDGGNNFFGYFGYKRTVGRVAAEQPVGRGGQP